MPDVTISRNFKVGGVLTNAASAVLSDDTATYGIRRNDTLAVVVAANTVMSNPSTGVYQYTFAATAGVAYTAFIKFVYNGDTFYVEVDIPTVADAATGMTCSYDDLLSRVGHELFGIRSGYSSDQTTDILQCIQDGLHYVYTAHDWSFFHPVKDVTTTAPYATGTVTIAAGVVTLTGGTWPSWAAQGLLKVSNSYYAVSTRTSNTQITLADTSVTVTAATAFQLGRPEIPLDDSFEAVANDSDLTYYPDQNVMYPPVRQRADQSIRTMQQSNPYYWRPMYYSVRTVQFDPTVGSRKRLAFYPTPDAAYVLRVPMILRPTMVSSSNPYPVGGETLAQLIIEACLSSVEMDYFEKPANPRDPGAGRHTKMYWQMLPLAIQADQEKSAPTQLGPDCPRGEGYYSGFDYGYDYFRAAHMGAVTLDGETL